MYLHFKNITMKTSTLKTGILSLLAVLFIGNIAFSQYDDLYYEASDEVYFADVEEEYVEEHKDDYGYSSFDEDDGYYYSSRIRRFSRPTNSIGYFSPLYTNSFNYGRYSPYGINNIYSRTGARIIGNNAYGYSSLSNPYLNPLSRNAFGSSFNSFGRVGGAGFSNAYYCPPIGGLGTSRAVVNNNNSARNAPTVNSSRRSGTVSSSTPSRTGTTRTARTARDYRGTTSSRSTVRTDRTRSTSRSTSNSLRGSSRSSSNYSTPSRSTSTRSSSVRSSSPRTSSSSRSSSSRSSSSRSSRG